MFPFDYWEGVLCGRMYNTYDEQALMRCENCNRTFSDTAIKHHQKSCTKDNPAKPAGTGLTGASLTNKMVGTAPSIF